MEAREMTVPRDELAREMAKVLGTVAKFRDQLRENARFADVDEARMQRNHADRLDKILSALRDAAP
jgi:hypothetical protein